jgi:hypothetical protein
MNYISCTVYKLYTHIIHTHIYIYIFALVLGDDVLRSDVIVFYLPGRRHSRPHYTYCTHTHTHVEIIIIYAQDLSRGGGGGGGDGRAAAKGDRLGAVTIPQSHI